MPALRRYPYRELEEASNEPTLLDLRRCDESRCQSSGVEAIVNRTDQIGSMAAKATPEDGSDAAYGINRFDCYYRPQDNERMLCAPGYHGIPIDAEPPRLFTSPNFRPNIPIEQRYYTCCPSKELDENSDNDSNEIGENSVTVAAAAEEEEEEESVSEASDLRRHCSDPKKMVREILPNNPTNEIDTSSNTTETISVENAMPCDASDADGRIFPRPMTPSRPFYSDTYLCCDEVLESTKEEATAATQDPPDASSLADGVCDESRCIARAVGEFMPGFGCWGEGPGELHPYACSDGYVGIPVNDTTDQPLFFDERQPLYYYTCCPPSFAKALADAQSSSTSSDSSSLQEPLVVRRHCSDPIVYNPANESASELVCHDPRLRYPRKQNKNGHFMMMITGQPVTTETYVCCDAELQTNDPNGAQKALSAPSGAATSYLDEIDCLSACDPNYFFDCIADNEYGLLWPMACDDPNGIFVEPKVVGQGYLAGGTTLFFHKYGCCRKGFGDGPFIQDRAFQQTVWPQLILSAISLATSLLLVVALLLSFYHGGEKQDRFSTSAAPGNELSTLTPSRGDRSSQFGTDRSRDRSNCSSVNFSAEFSTAQRDGSSRRISTPRDGSSRRLARKNSRISRLRDSNKAYNAYLVYLAIPDMFLNLWVVCMYGGYVNQRFNPVISSYIVNSIFYERKTAFDMAVILGCSAANMYLNSIICYQLFTLLKNSRRRKRTAPPTFRRVGVQSLVAYLLAIGISLIRYFLADIQGIPEWVEVTVYFLVSAGIPILYLCYVCIVIWIRKLLPSLRGPLRILTLYFFRIIAVFVVLWLPGILLLSLACNWTWDDTDAGNATTNIVLYPIGLYFCTIQPLLSVGLALTKPDVRWAVVRLVTLSYCRRKKEGSGNDDDENLPKLGLGSSDEEIPKKEDGGKDLAGGETPSLGSPMAENSAAFSIPE